MNKSTRRWIPVVVFWFLFVGSVVLSERFSWIGTTWTVLLLIVVIAGSLYSVLHAGRDEKGNAFQGGYPRWFLRFANDEGTETAQQAKDSSRS